MTLYDCLEEYKDITLKLIDKIKLEENVEELLKKRADILKKIEEITFDKEGFKEIIDDLNILDLENEAQKLIKAKKLKIKKQIDTLKKNRVARNQYMNSQEKPNYFSAKI